MESIEEEKMERGREKRERKMPMVSDCHRERLWGLFQEAVGEGAASTYSILATGQLHVCSLLYANPTGQPGHSFGLSLSS